ncbi:MAG: hypothetical protein Q8K14_01710 [Hydrogenophaga sp.]|uniref:hypothetical protein n=1 Tax=Hydrogenophaga sp. TaxID=1904254 RepID=UPI0027321F31|nr:hypothetical protein [Hydrogenophaga sp.]MDP2249129.1 hypothetical protein [Hydrogenophaga sp.]
MHPDRFHRPARAGLPALLVALAIGLSGCVATAPPLAPATSAAPSTPLAPPACAPAPDGGMAAPSVLGPGAGAAPSCAPTVEAKAADPRALTDLLTYAERLHALPAAELTAQITALGDPGQQPLGLMQLALALTHTHQPVDTARALGLFQRVIAQPGTASLPYKPLARLLAGLLTDQRRLEEAAERQNQQLREQQRRIEQLTERLEAMRAIERSLNPRPGTAPGARSPRPPVTP